MLGKTEGRRRGGQKMRPLDGVTILMDMSLSNSRRQWKTGKPGVLQSMGSQRVRHNLATGQQQQYTISSTLPHALQILNKFHPFTLPWNHESFVTAGPAQKE